MLGSGGGAARGNAVGDAGGGGEVEEGLAVGI